MMLRRRHQLTGFTLLEVLLALAAFAILSVTVIAVFMSSGREERRGVARQREVGSAQFLLEQMAREVRLGVPDYEYYATNGIALATGATANPVRRLAIKFTDGTFRYYRCWAHHQWLDSTGGFIAEKWDWCETPYTGLPTGHTSAMADSVIIASDQPSAKCINNALLDPPCTVAGPPINWGSASLGNALVREFQVYITPPADPFPSTATDLRQPLTTVALTIEGTGKTEEQVRTTFQTSASSRTYAP